MSLLCRFWRGEVALKPFVMSSGGRVITTAGGNASIVANLAMITLAAAAAWSWVWFVSVRLHFTRSGCTSRRAARVFTTTIGSADSLPSQQSVTVVLGPARDATYVQQMIYHHFAVLTIFQICSSFSK